MITLTTSADCDSYLRDIWKDNTIETKERVYVVFLNVRGERMGRKCICKGLYAECLIDTREIAKQAIKLDCHHLVLAHNHPSGNTEPSEQDLILTETLNLVMKELQIELIDHIILTKNSYFSFADQGLIKRVGHLLG